MGCAAAGFRDASLWEVAKKKGDAEIMKMINKALENTSVTVVFIGNKTTGRKFINYEIEQSIARGNGIVGIQIRHLKNEDGETEEAGATPVKLTNGGYKVYKYVDAEKLATKIE
jgi:hypothetical protein